MTELQRPLWEQSPGLWLETPGLIAGCRRDPEAFRVPWKLG